MSERARADQTVGVQQWVPCRQEGSSGRKGNARHGTPLWTRMAADSRPLLAGGQKSMWLRRGYRLAPTGAQPDSEVLYISVPISTSLIRAQTTCICLTRTGAMVCGKTPQTRGTPAGGLGQASEAHTIAVHQIMGQRVMGVMSRKKPACCQGEHANGQGLWPRDDEPPRGTF